MSDPIIAAKNNAINVWHRSVNSPKLSTNDRFYDAMDAFSLDMHKLRTKWRNRGFWDRVFNREP